MRWISPAWYLSTRIEPDITRDDPLESHDWSTGQCKPSDT
jgi:hypothetical protein